LRPSVLPAGQSDNVGQAYPGTIGHPAAQIELGGVFPPLVSCNFEQSLPPKELASIERRLFRF